MTDSGLTDLHAVFVIPPVNDLGEITIYEYCGIVRNGVPLQPKRKEQRAVPTHVSPVGLRVWALLVLCTIEDTG